MILRYSHLLDVGESGSATGRWRSPSVGVETLDRPVGPDGGDAGRRGDLQPVQEPDRHRAVPGTAPDDVARAVALDVAGAGDGPVAADGGDAARRQNLQPVQ